MRGITQAELARRMKTSASHLNALENGHRVMTLTTLESAARGLSVEIAEIFPKGKERVPTPAERIWFRLADRLHDESADYLRRVEELLGAFDRAVRGH